jgi:S1-C subfamily serine protease
MNKANSSGIRRVSKLAVGLTWALLAASLALAGQARAADDQDLSQAEADAREAEIQAQLEEAEHRLEQAESEMDVREAEVEIQFENAGRRLEQAESELELQEAELEIQLESAQLRLEEAARQIAELSAQLVGDATVIALGSLRSVRAPRPMLGINIGSAGDNSNEGVLVEGVTPGGPADNAGIQTGDVLVEIDGQSLEGGESDSGITILSDYMDDVEEGQAVVLRLVRGGKSQSITVVPENMNPLRLAFTMSDDWDFDFEELEELEGLGHRYRAGPHGYQFRLGHAEYWGDMELVTLTPELGEYFGAEEGILVVRAPDEAALQLQDGDVIVDIDGRKPGDPAQAMRILRSYDRGESVKLGIVRKKKQRTLDIELPVPDLGAYFRAEPSGHPLDGQVEAERHIILKRPSST